MCGCPYAGITFLDWSGARQFWKAGVGLPADAATSIPLPDAAAEAQNVCCQTVKLPPGSVQVVEDVSQDETYRNNPVIVGLGLKHVAATALVTPDDLCIGTLIVMDTTAHGLTVQQQESLRRLARAVVRTLELHAAAVERERLRVFAANAAVVSARAKDDLIALISHEVRTPLQAVSGAVSLLAGTELSTAQLDLLRLLDEGATQLARVVTDIVDYDALAPGEAPARPREALPYRLLADVLAPALSLESLPAATASRLRSRRVALRHSVGPRVPGTLLGDAPALRRILTALVANAMKYAPDDGTGAVTVRVERCAGGGTEDSDCSDDSEEDVEAVGAPPPAPSEPHAGGTHLRIRVTDNGSGIASWRVNSIFMPLGSTDDTARHQHGGAGLNLAICRRLANAMGATLKARSGGSGTGAQFTLTLPLALALPVPGSSARDLSPVRDETLAADAELLSLDGAAAGAPSPAQVQTAAPKQPLRRPDGSPLRVLLAEDNVLCAAVVLRLLSRAGAAVTLVLDGAQAVQQCAAPGAEFDLILMDLEMPVLDGVSAAVEIAALGEQQGRSMPTVALSANCSDAVRDRCVAAGMATIMSKPLRVEHLQALRAYACC